MGANKTNPKETAEPEVEPLPEAGSSAEEPVDGRPAAPSDQAKPSKIIFKKASRFSGFPRYLVSQPVQEADRSDEDVVGELVERESRFDPSATFRRALREIEETSAWTVESMRRRQATFFINTFLLPFIEGRAEATGISPAETLRTLIRDKKPMGAVLSDNRGEVEALMAHPGLRMLTASVRPFLKMEDDEVRSEIVVEWWLERAKETRLDFYRVMVAEENGRWWLGETLVDLLNFIKGKFF